MDGVTHPSRTTSSHRPISEQNRNRWFRHQFPSRCIRAPSAVPRPIRRLASRWRRWARPSRRMRRRRWVSPWPGWRPPRSAGRWSWSPPPPGCASAGARSPGAWPCWGAGPERLIWVRADKEAQALWALEEALKSGAVAGGLATVEQPALRRHPAAGLRRPQRRGAGRAAARGPAQDLSAARRRWRIAARASGGASLRRRRAGPGAAAGRTGAPPRRPARRLGSGAG